jgi:hypothetical protein
MTSSTGLDSTIGAVFLAVLFAIFMFGIMTLQVYVYLIGYPDDSPFQRFFVRGLWLLDLAHTVFISIMAYHYMVTNFANIQVLEKIHWTWAMALILEALITLLVQFFLALRTYRIKRERWLLFTSSIFWTIAQLGFGIAASLFTLESKTFHDLNEKLPRAIAAAWCSVGVIGDIFIMIGLVSTLRSSRTGFRRSDHIISKLIQWSIESGIATTIFAILDLVLFVFVHNLVHLIFNFMLAKLYTNTLMATLNARRSLQNSASKHRTASDPNAGHEFSVRSPIRSPVSPTSPNQDMAANGVGITVHTVQHSDAIDEVVWGSQKSKEISRFNNFDIESLEPRL